MAVISVVDGVGVEGLVVPSVMCIVHVLYSESYSEVDAVLYVSADVEIVVADISCVLTRQHIVGGGIISRILLHIEVVGVEMVDLAVGTVAVVEGTVTPLLICQFVARRIVKSSGSTKDEIEVPALAVVESQIEERVITSAH